MKRIAFYEPWFFIFFGVFHLHRIWALLDREGYAGFWIGVLTNRGVFYYALMLVLALLCVLGIIRFFRCLHHNYWWRWIYLLGGFYLLFDLVSIQAGFSFWNELLLWMFDTSSPYWDALWLFFILLGAFSFGLGIYLLFQYAKQQKIAELRKE